MQTFTKNRCHGRCRNRLGRFCDGKADCPPVLENHKWKENLGMPDDECSPECVGPNGASYSCSADGFEDIMQKPLPKEWLIECDYVVSGLRVFIQRFSSNFSNLAMLLARIWSQRPRLLFATIDYILEICVNFHF